jgi:hypothetical protein
MNDEPHDVPEPDELGPEISDLTGKRSSPACAYVPVDVKRLAGRKDLGRSAIFVLLVVVAAVVVYSAHYAIPGSPLSPVPAAVPVTFLPLEGLGCVQSSAWSPSGDMVAVTGLLHSACARSGYAADVINIYRPRTDTFFRQLHPDPGIFSALGLSQQVAGTPSPSGTPLPVEISYSNLLWSPDGTRLALTFALSS